MFVNKAQICLSTKHRYVCQQSIYIKHRYVTKVPTVKLHIYGHLVEQVDFLCCSPTQRQLEYKPQYIQTSYILCLYCTSQGKQWASTLPRQDDRLVVLTDGYTVGSGAPDKRSFYHCFYDWDILHANKTLYNLHSLAKWCSQSSRVQETSSAFIQK